MPYYHNLITKKSWKELQILQREVAFVLIGGWATYLYTHALKSKDIDIIVDFDQLPKLAQRYELHKNDRLKKYEAIAGDVHVDVYLPHYSQLGIPVEELMQHTQSVEGFTLLDPTFLLALKIYILAQRGHSLKGAKDFIDSIALSTAHRVNTQMLCRIVKRYKMQKQLQIFLALLDEHTELPELNLDRHRFAKLKKELSSALEVS